METRPAAEPPAWHAMPPGEVLAALDATADGLSPDEAASRLARFGPNAIAEQRPLSPLRVFARQFASPLIYLLLAAAAVSLLIGDRGDAGFIFGVLLLNAFVGAFQEWRADTSARALRSMVPQVARVRRGGTTAELPSEALVAGDLVELEGGMRVPADLRLIETLGLLVDEGALTGESLPVAKDARARLAPLTALADRINLAHAGTSAVGGRARGVVVATGTATGIGRIGGAIGEIARTRQGSPLLRRMAWLARQIAVGAVGLILLLAVLLALEGESLRDIALLSIALAVSAIPEGLPVAVTVALSAAASRMARRNVIVRRLPAVEGLGSATLIASDKTGTLTMNRLTVERAVLAGRGLDRAQWQGGERPEALRALARSAALCNEARFDAQGMPVGDSVDVALLEFAGESGQQVAALLGERRLAIIPYEPVQRFAAAEVEIDGAPLLVVKGAPETVLPMCTQAGAWAREAADQLAAEGYRVLVLAQRRERGVGSTIGERLHGLQVVGLVGLADPLRPGVPEAVARCLAAGISVRMITGDHPVTALAIARRIGIADELADVVGGAELAGCGDDPAAWAAQVSRATVFARIEPAQKLAIVRAFQRRGEIVAVTGDGVNDGPALQAADVGIAMGRGGTDVARGASDLILADDNFVSIVAGIEEGRTTFLNIRKMALFVLATGVAEIGMFLCALAVGLPMPLTAVQLLWLNVVTNGVQDVTLGFGRGEGLELREPPRRGLASLLDRDSLVMLACCAAAMTLIAVGLMAAELGEGSTLDQARNSVLLMVVLFQNVLLLSIRHLHHPVWRIRPPENRWLLAGIVAALMLQLVAMHWPPLQQLLGLAPPSLTTLGRCLAGMVVVLAVAEAAKWLARRQRKAGP
jgi:Ca2+-transporting ATPase